MKEIMNQGPERGSLLSRDFTSQNTTCPSVMERRKHLCVVCALRKHDFEERMPEPEADGCNASPLAKAWIDGLPYRSVYHIDSQGTSCTDCGEKVIMTYDPEFTNEQPFSLPPA